MYTAAILKLTATIFNICNFIFISMYLLLLTNVILDFICSGFAKLCGTGMERKMQNETLCIQRDSNTRLERPSKVIQRLDRSGIGLRRLNVIKTFTVSYMIEMNTRVTKLVSV